MARPGVGPRSPASGSAPTATTEGATSPGSSPVRAPFIILGADDYTRLSLRARPDPGTSRNVNVVRTETLASTTGTVTGEGDDARHHWRAGCALPALSPAAGRWRDAAILDHADRQPAAGRSARRGHRGHPNAGAEPLVERNAFCTTGIHLRTVLKPLWHRDLTPNGGRLGLPESRASNVKLGVSPCRTSHRLDPHRNRKHARSIDHWLAGALTLVAAIGYAQQPSATASGDRHLLDAGAHAVVGRGPRQRPAQQSGLPPDRKRSHPGPPALLNANSSLLLPSASLNGSYFWSDKGVRFFQGISFNGPTSSQRSASFQLNYSLSGTTIAQPRPGPRRSARHGAGHFGGPDPARDERPNPVPRHLLEAQAQEAVARRSLRACRASSSHLASARQGSRPGQRCSTCAAPRSARERPRSRCCAPSRIREPDAHPLQRDGVPSAE